MLGAEFDLGQFYKAFLAFDLDVLACFFMLLQVLLQELLFASLTGCLAKPTFQCVLQIALIGDVLLATVGVVNAFYDQRRQNGIQQGDVGLFEGLRALRAAPQ